MVVCIVAFVELRESNGESSNNIFKALGLDYRFVADGNDLETLINVFKDVKILTIRSFYILLPKGKGYAIAEQNKEAFHRTRPFDLETGKLKRNIMVRPMLATIADHLMEQIQSRSNSGSYCCRYNSGGFGFNAKMA